MRHLIFALMLLCALPVQAQEAMSEKKHLPRRSDAGLHLAEYYISEHKYAEALEVLEKVIYRHPNNADGHTYIGYTLMQIGNADEGIKSIERALKINPAHLGANQYLGEYYAGKGETNRAFEQLQAIRMICKKSHCPEKDALQSAINTGKSN